MTYQRKFFCDENWLNERLNQSTDNLVVLEVTGDLEDFKLDAVRYHEDYLNSHIPSALSFPTNALGEIMGYFNSAESMRDVFLSYGVTKDTELVLYSKYSPNATYTASRRCLLLRRRSRESA